nr:hypothetical protein [Clostridium sp. 19966]
MHNLKYTDKTILDSLNSSIKRISVNQGYTKCSTAIISKNAVMTSDKCIAKALLENKVEVLFLPPGDILLPDLAYGFIGGACGLLDYNNLAFFGNINRYKYGSEVKHFLRKHNIEAYCLSDDKLSDRGTLMCI